MWSQLVRASSDKARLLNVAVCRDQNQRKKGLPTRPAGLQVRNNPATPPLEVGSPVAPDDGAYYGGELGPRLSGGGEAAAVSIRMSIYVISMFLLIL